MQLESLLRRASLRQLVLQVHAVGLFSPASHRRLGNVQTIVECGIDIAGKHLLDRA